VVADYLDTLDLGRLALKSGEGRRLDPRVRIDPFSLGGQRYEAQPDEVQTRLDVSHTTNGYALRLRYDTRLAGPCMRCLEPAERTIPVDSREVDQPGGDEDLDSPYMDGELLDLRSWARDALALAMPDQLTCTEDCKGLCGICGENLNEHPAHEHEKQPDPRWEALKELKLD
jgi:DUF177 domain-containing protein